MHAFEDNDVFTASELKWRWQNQQKGTVSAWNEDFKLLKYILFFKSRILDSFVIVVKWVQCKLDTIIISKKICYFFLKSIYYNYSVSGKFIGFIGFNHHWFIFFWVTTQLIACLHSNEKCWRVNFYLYFCESISMMFIFWFQNSRNKWWSKLCKT